MTTRAGEFAAASVLAIGMSCAVATADDWQSFVCVVPTTGHKERHVFDMTKAVVWDAYGHRSRVEESGSILTWELPAPLGYTYHLDKDTLILTDEWFGLRDRCQHDARATSK
jgi:hypothetical protein